MATADSANDDGEGVKLSFGTPLPTGVSAGPPSETTVSITDDDVPAVTVMFGAATYTAAEGGQVEVSVTLSAAPERSVVVPIAATLEGGATSADYSGVPSNVTFASGETSQTITFMATADSANDDGEGVKLSFGTPMPTGVSAGPPSETTVSITDDDVPAVTVMFGAATYTAAEGGQVEVTVTLSAAPERTVVVPIEEMLEDGATSGDYSGVPSNVTFTSGETSQTITFMATADSANDDGEGVKLSFGAMLPAGRDGGHAQRDDRLHHRRRRTRRDRDVRRRHLHRRGGRPGRGQRHPQRRPGTHRGRPHRRHPGGRSHDRRLLGGPLDRHLRLRRHQPDDHLHGHGRLRQRRR